MWLKNNFLFLFKYVTIYKSVLRVFLKILCWLLKDKLKILKLANK